MTENPSGLITELDGGNERFDWISAVLTIVNTVCNCVISTVFSKTCWISSSLANFVTVCDCELSVVCSTACGTSKSLRIFPESATVGSQPLFQKHAGFQGHRRCSSSLELCGLNRIEDVRPALTRLRFPRGKGRLLRTSVRLQQLNKKSLQDRPVLLLQPACPPLQTRAERTPQRERFGCTRRASRVSVMPNFDRADYAGRPQSN